MIMTEFSGLDNYCTATFQTAKMSSWTSLRAVRHFYRTIRLHHLSGKLDMFQEFEENLTIAEEGWLVIPCSPTIL